MDLTQALLLILAHLVGFTKSPPLGDGCSITPPSPGAEVDLSRCNRDIVNYKTMQELRVAGSLKMEDMGISSLPPDIFNATEFLTAVSLAYNPELVIGDNFLIHDSIIRLDISYCNLEIISPSSFGGLTQLERVDAKGNPGCEKYRNIAVEAKVPWKMTCGDEPDAPPTSFPAANKTCCLPPVPTAGSTAPPIGPPPVPTKPTAPPKTPGTPESEGGFPTWATILISVGLAGIGLVLAVWYVRRRPTIMRISRGTATNRARDDPVEFIPTKE